MKSSTHPSEFISKQLSGNIRIYSGEAETLRQLHPTQLEIIYRQNWFNLFVPEKYGGLGLSFVEGLQTEEALAWIDGNVGWTVTLCSGANYFIGFLDSKARDDIFVNPKVCLSGSGYPSGIARKIKDGYVVTGRWKFATGAPHATVFTATCRIDTGDGSLQEHENGKQDTAAFWFRKDEVTVREDWNTTGMIATASHSFEITKVQVPDNRFFIIDPSRTTLPDPVYRYPFVQFAQATLAVNICGMAIHFIDLAKIILQQRQAHSDRVLAHEKKLNRTRRSFYKSIKKSWHELTSDGLIKPATLNEVTDISQKLATTARKSVDELYPYCGLIAASQGSEINRVWRDLHTAIQHSLFRNQ